MFCLFICAFVFASNSGLFRINDLLLFFTPLLLLNYFLFNLFLFLQKSGGNPSLCVVPEIWLLISILYCKVYKISYKEA